MLLLLLALPIVMGQNLLPSREQSYLVQGWGNGLYPWIYNQIFEETNDVDIAFVGSSHINDLDTPYVLAKLSEKLGRPAVVRTLPFAGAAYDGLYFITRDLLTHRRVRLLVFYDEKNVLHYRNNAIPTLFRFADDAYVLPGLSLPEQALLYFAAVVGMPRNGLCLLRDNLPAPLDTNTPNYWKKTANAPPGNRFGYIPVFRGFAPDPGARSESFKRFAPAQPAQAADAMVYSPATKTNFEFSTVPLPAWQAHFARLFAALTREHGVKTVMLYLPVTAELRRSAIPERTFWPEIMNGVVLLGVPPLKMFGTLTDAEASMFYCDPGHFNLNGSDYFTPLITPALIKLYENQPAH